MKVVLSGHTLDCSEVAAIAAGAPVVLAGEAREAMAANARRWVELGAPDILARKEAWLVGSRSAASSSERLRAFVLGHCAGVGEALPVPLVRALMACRANVLAVGLSGCRPEAADQLIAMLNAGVHPVVPAQGSVGAAGDLSPLAHVSRVAFRFGGQAELEGRVLPAEQAMAGLPAYEPTGKEVLSLINGATLTVAMGALSVHRALQLMRVAESALAMSMEVVLADLDCLDSRALAARNHAGPVGVSARLRELLRGSELAHTGRKADAFSIRCAPAVLGAAWDALESVERTVVLELNGACDNPLVFDDGIIECGNFHGAPVALALDHLKVALTQVGSISERRLFRLTYGQLTGNLPSFLIESSGVQSGFMLAQYTAASLVSECKGLSHPASVDSIPTGQHHEDHVPMGPAAARTLHGVTEALAAILAIEVLVAAQGLDFRREGRSWSAAGELLPAAPAALAPRVQALLDTVRQAVPRWTEDRVLHGDIQAVLELLDAGRLG